MARSVAELLPKRFEDLDLEDVAGIIESIGDESETLWFERKAEVSANSLAKACAAFANTYGGLLVVGVGNTDAELVGVESLAAEAQLWVKDTLRSRVLPMPPFRARWLPTTGERGILLVLVEESSTTPHLLRRQGAIYVRNPGSSDPVPIDDQRRLLELTDRGSEASNRAIRVARDRLDMQVTAREDGYEDYIIGTEFLALAATGVAANFERDLFQAETPDVLSESLWGAAAARDKEQRLTFWRQHEIGLVREVLRMFRTSQGNRISAIAVSRNGSVLLVEGHTPPLTQTDRGFDSLDESTLRANFHDAANLGRSILLSLGAHGDVRLAYRLAPGGRNVHFNVRPGAPLVNEVEVAHTVETWTDFDEDVTSRVFDEVARAYGIAPT